MKQNLRWMAESLPHRNIAESENYFGQWNHSNDSHALAAVDLSSSALIPRGFAGEYFFLKKFFANVFKIIQNVTKVIIIQWNFELNRSPMGRNIHLKYLFASFTTQFSIIIISDIYYRCSTFHFVHGSFQENGTSADSQWSTDHFC